LGLRQARMRLTKRTTESRGICGSIGLDGFVVAIPSPREPFTDGHKVMGKE